MTEQPTETPLLLQKLRSNYESYMADAEEKIRESIEQLEKDIVDASKKGLTEIFVGYSKLFRYDLFRNRYVEWVTNNGLRWGKNDSTISISGVHICFTISDTANTLSKIFCRNIL